MVTQRSARIGAIRALEPLLETLFPAHCVACGQAGAWLCAACIAAIPGRGRLIPVTRRHIRPEEMAGALALSTHDRPLREAVHALKYGGLRALAEPLGTLLAAGWRQQGIVTDLVVPVPLHRTHQRRRGYNQSVLLAETFSEHTGIPCATRELERVRPTRTQVGLSSVEREENVRGAFVCQDAVVRGARVVLLDDVLTTGATMCACARALQTAGASEVWGLSLTCAVPPGHG